MKLIKPTKLNLYSIVVLVRVVTDTNQDCPESGLKVMRMHNLWKQLQVQIEKSRMFDKFGMKYVNMSFKKGGQNRGSSGRRISEFFVFQ